MGNNQLMGIFFVIKDKTQHVTKCNCYLLPKFENL